MGITSFFLFFIIVFILSLYQTMVRKGPLGVNFSKVFCPKCGKLMPVLRVSKSFSQVLFGGWTCLYCGTQLNKWGREENSKRDMESKHHQVLDKSVNGLFFRLIYALGIILFVPVVFIKSNAEMPPF